jgi:lipid-binding SYLF domain-containing protein
MSWSRTAILACLTAAACSSGKPKTPAESANLEQKANATVGDFKTQDPSLENVLSSAAGIAVFPSIGKGGMIVGGAHGQGVLMENGQTTGFLTLNQASIGAQLGAESFSEILVLRDADALAKLKAGNFKVSGNVSATALSAGAAAQAEFNEGMSAFVRTRGGAMVDISVAGQKIDYRPRNL